jgi:type II secretory ATPase GspE/PulE/Tfp pilus assembly ATPase PilB-like protein
VAVIGTGFARVLALRILSRQVPALPALGYPRPALLTLLDALRGRSGLVLFAGPTGSGKTTGIASFMSLLAAGGRKIVTLEDPIEYRIPGTLQIERGGRHITGREISAALRQDPDILVLGEARSRDQAQQMGQALRSGHLVVTSVHATGRRGTKGRLHELGIPDGALRETRALCCQTMEGQPRRLRAQCWMYPWRDQHER